MALLIPNDSGQHTCISPRGPVFDSQRSQDIFSAKILDGAEIYRQRALLSQWSVQKSLIDDRTHPLLVRAALQKNINRI